MSERMSRREMRKAGLLKPRQEAESEDRSPHEDVTTPDVPIGSADNPLPEAPAAEHDGGPETAAFTPQQSAEATMLGGDLASPATPDSAPESGDDEPQAAPERTSVFDRFAQDSDQPESDRPSPVLARDDEFASALDEDAAVEESDFADALRAKLKAKPPTDEDDDTAESIDDEFVEPSRWKTIVLFLLLIIVGFGVGILLGSLIFSGGDSAAAASAAIHHYPGAL